MRVWKAGNRRAHRGRDLVGQGAMMAVRGKQKETLACTTPACARS